MKTFTKILPLISLILMAIAIGSVNSSHIDSLAMRIVSVEDTVDSADVIIVYGGGGGRRIKHAAQLAEAGYAKNILILGTNGEKEYAASILDTWLKGRQINLLFPDVSLPDTKTSADFAAGYIAKAGVRSAIMVTDDWHLRRVSLLMKNNNVNNSHIMYSHPQTQLNEWWTRVDKTMLVAEECAKVAFCSMMLLV